MLENNPEPQSVRELEEPINSRRKARQKRVQKVIKYFGLSGTGIGISGIVGLLVKGQFKAAGVLGLFTIAVTLLAIAYKFVSGVTNRVLDKISEELENIEEPLAQWIVNQPKRFFNWWRWKKKDSQFQNQYYESLIDTFREFKIEGFRIGLPVLDLENVFVSLQVVPEIPAQITGAMIKRQVEAERQEIWEFLAQSSKKKFQAFRRLAVIAPPGSGKTTLLKHLTLIYAKKQSQVHKAPKLIPVLLYLRDIRHLIITEKPPNLPQLIREHIKNLPACEPLNPPKHWIEERLKMGKCLVMLDGLDEVADSIERTRVSQWVNRQMALYRQTVFILTSRPHGFKTAPLEQVGTVLEVLPFNSKQVKQFIQSWYTQTEIMSRAGRDTPAVLLEAQNNANDLIKRIMDNRAIAEMAKNPLLVTMIATVHYCGSALPGRRVELYQRICDLLLGSRQEAKKIETPLTGEQNKSVLQVLALALMQLKTRQFTLFKGQELIQAELERVAGSALTPSQFLKQIKEVSGLLVERELGVYEFAHLSFQEYLAAAQVKELQQNNLLIENLQDNWWAETIRLYAAQSDATKIISAALENPTVNSLTLALDCLQESLKVESVIRKQLEEMLEAGLESADKDIFKLAAEVMLAKRLNQFWRIDENREIDTSYITNAEYRLFLEYQVFTTERDLTDELFLSAKQLPIKNPKNPITLATWKQAIVFCGWLDYKINSTLHKQELNEDSYYYRLPNNTEILEYPAKEHQELACWGIGENTANQIKKGIRLVKTKIPALFGFDTITVDAQGQRIDRESCYVQYFTEELGNGVTLDMVYIPGGEFMMGSSDEEVGGKSEKPQHKVSLRSFFMGKYPITQAQWKVIASLPKVKRNLEAETSYFKGDERPVETVSWSDAVEFCQRLSQRTGKEYCLPTEAKWEYACRAGTITPFHFGETVTDKLANYSASEIYANELKGKSRKQTTSVGSFSPNAFGLYDMHGQVFEWCEDDWHDSYRNAPNDGSAWLSRERSIKVMRGGSWNDIPNYCRSAYRKDNNQKDRFINFGFRVVCLTLETI